MSSKRRLGLLAAVAVVATSSLLFTPGAAGAADDRPPAIEIAQVGGQTVRDGQVPNAVSGQVGVHGTASTADEPTVQQLVADAGDSAFVGAGDRAVLLGSGYGGTAPYTFAWNTAHGALTAKNSSSTELKTEGLAAGTYDVSLTVTDAAGTTATDTVKVVVYEPTTTTPLNEAYQDETPGVTLVLPVDREFEVPEGTGRIDAKVTWTNEDNDYDLYLYDKDGREAASSAAGTPDTDEETSVDNPVPGKWTFSVDRYLTATDTLTMKVVLTSKPADPRPEVAAGGPYSFATDAPQVLRGTVEGGAGPVSAGWDLDGDGVFETPGTQVYPNLPEGRHLVTLKATDAKGLERRETTSVLVADPSVIETQTTPVTVIGVADTGINPYHLEFSARTYPDPDVLELTGDFTKHPSQYIPGYPKGAQALNIMHGQGYLPAGDGKIWDGNTTIKAGELYWIPGTKIVGALDAGGSTGATSGDDPHPILDDNGHGSGSASVSAGNRYGYCPTCLLVVVEGLDETVVAKLPWVDISTNSFGYVGGAPAGLVGDPTPTKEAAERGQTTLFAAGNGVGNAFDVPVITWHSDQTGPDWNITVGALRRDNQRAIVGDGIPVHLSSWGDGNLPSACGEGTVGQCAFGGTSAATPYTAGVFGTTLTKVRAAVGDGAAGQKPGQVVASGIPREESVYLADGELTRDELRQAVLKSALPLGEGRNGAPYPYPLTAPYNENTNVLFEGYGTATPAAADRAVDVLLGRSQLPERPFEDEFFAFDRSVRDTLWGGFDRDGDGAADSEAMSPTQAAGLGLSLAGVADVQGALQVLSGLSQARAAEDRTVTRETAGDGGMAYYLHRNQSQAGAEPVCGHGNELSMDQENSDGDVEPCFESRITSVAAGYRPLGIWASRDTLDAPLPTGTTVTMDLYLTTENPTMVKPTGVLAATDREIGTGEGEFAPVMGYGTGPGSNANGEALPDGGGCVAAGEQCWTKFSLAFETTRPAFTGEQLTFQVQLPGARAWSFGYEGEHASKISIEPAALPQSGLTFGATLDAPAEGSKVSESETVIAGGSYEFPDLGLDPTGAGDHPTSRRVEVSVDDESFTHPKEAVLDSESGTWRRNVGDELTIGEHTLYARARMNTTTSEVSTSTFTIRPDEVVPWQVVDRNERVNPDAWRAAAGVADWSFAFDTAHYGKGWKTIVVRLTELGDELTRSTVQARVR